MDSPPLGSNQSCQAGECGNQHDQKRCGCPTKVLPKRGNAQQQAEEDQDQNSTGHIKVLERFFGRYLIAGGKNAGGKNTDTKTENIEPKVRGVVIVCGGGDDPAVRARVLEAVTKALDIGADKVCITK